MGYIHGALRISLVRMISRSVARGNRSGGGTGWRHRAPGLLSV